MPSGTAPKSGGGVIAATHKQNKLNAALMDADARSLELAAAKVATGPYANRAKKSSKSSARTCSKKGTRRTFSKTVRATQNKNRQAKHYAMALKGINRRGGPITDVGLKRMGLQRLASGKIVKL